MSRKRRRARRARRQDAEQPAPPFGVMAIAINARIYPAAASIFLQPFASSSKPIFPEWRVPSGRMNREPSPVRLLSPAARRASAQSIAPGASAFWALFEPALWPSRAGARGATSSMARALDGSLRSPLAASSGARAPSEGDLVEETQEEAYPLRVRKRRPPLSMRPNRRRQVRPQQPSKRSSR